jgi:hypothetical protein
MLTSPKYAKSTLGDPTTTSLIKGMYPRSRLRNSDEETSRCAKGIRINSAACTAKHHDKIQAPTPTRIVQPSTHRAISRRSHKRLGRDEEVCWYNPYYLAPFCCMCVELPWPLQVVVACGCRSPPKFRLWWRRLSSHPISPRHVIGGLFLM